MIRMSDYSSAGEYRHNRERPSASMEKRRLVLLGYIIDLKARIPAGMRAQALKDIEVLRSNPTPAEIRNLEHKWGRG
jgi:hypothetical protein